MSEREPIDTSTPWGRPRKEMMDQVDFERHMHQRAVEASADLVEDPFMTPHARVQYTVQPYSITAPGYEPTRPMASTPDSRSIINKKGLRPVKSETYKEVDIWDKLVTIVVIGCFVGIIGITIYFSIKLG